MIVKRKRADGSSAYMARPSVRGKKLKAATFATLREAKIHEAKVLKEFGRPHTDETCDSFAKRWPRDYPVVKQGPTRGRAKSDGTLALYRSLLKSFIEEFEHVPLWAIDRQEARRFALRHPKAAAVVRGMLSDAADDGLIQANPFMGLRLEQSKGRAEHGVLTGPELDALAQCARAAYGPYGQSFAAMILFTGYAGLRLSECIALEWRDIDFAAETVHVRKAKFDKPRTVLLLTEAAEALRSMPRTVGQDHIFGSRRGRRLTKSSHFPIWSPIRTTFWSGLSSERQRELVGPLAWHSLRHACGFHFYVTLGYSDELTAYQLGHSDAKLVRTLYGHGRIEALDRMKARLRDTSGSQRVIEMRRVAGGFSDS